MPIRFRCVYCNQLLGISRRKAGNVVRCTNCGGQIIVPDAEPQPEAVAVGGGGERRATRKESLPDRAALLEHADIDSLFKPLAGEHQKLTDVATARSSSSQELFSIPEASNIAPAPAPKAAPGNPRSVMIGVAIGMLLVGLIVGYVIGRSMAG